ncbi:MAG: DNA cytosine methyltransferase, partial [Finegoldia magna]|nr:DNA cytosine methyltransferase [Finegoldia magna]
SGNTPTRNQGGVAIVEDTYSMSKNSHLTKVDKNITSPLLATDYKDPPLINQKLVRRLTPKECGRLQGFPDYWCDDLGIENPTDKDLTFWREVFDKDAEIKGLKKKKTDKQILKWLKNPHTDSAEYKMWGNGIALPCAIYIFKSLVNTANKT